MRMVRVAVISVAAGLFLSCEGSEFFSGPLTSESCSTGGRTHSGSVPSGTWRRAASPHVLVDSVVVDSTLTIEPGSLVCGMPGSSLTVPELEAVGAEDSPIVFTSDDPDGWGGLRGAGVLRNARIEGTVIALLGAFELERSVILRTRWYAVIPRGQVILRDVVIDSACTDLAGCGAVSVSPFGGATLEDVVIRWSGGDGIQAGGQNCHLTIDGGRVEGSAGVGLRMMLSPRSFSICVFNLIEPVRITGGAEHPAIVTAGAAVQFLRDAETQASLTGNALDELIVTGDHDFGDADLTLTRLLPVSVRLRCFSGHRKMQAQLGTITMQAGASLAFVGCDFGLHLRANGTAAEPVTISGRGVGRLRTTAGHADTAHLRHVVLTDNVILRAVDAPMILENITLHDSSLDLVAAGSRIDGIDAVGSNAFPFLVGPDPWPALVLHSGTSLRNARIEQSLVDGIVVEGDDVSIDTCTITTSAQHGIRVLAGAPVIRSCNIVANSGDGIHNAGSGQADAVLNWWGDEMGPLGPDGDGVHGNVLYDPFLAAPAAGAGGGKYADRNPLTWRR
jgi:hypothetical protein